jgi:signal transduction histidine kinase
MPPVALSESETAPFGAGQSATLAALQEQAPEVAATQAAWPWWRVPVAALAVCTALGLFFSTSFSGFPGAFIEWYAWGALLGPIVWLDRRLPIARERLIARVAWHLALGVAWTMLYLYVSSVGGALVRGMPLLPALSLAVAKGGLQGAFHWNLVVYWMIVGGHWALDHHQRWRERQQRAAELERLLAEARLGALRAQLRPHFLFNGLNAISAYVESEPQTARRMLGHLGDLLRWSLEDGESQEVALANELALLDHYLAIQRVRFQDRLTVDLDVDPAVLWVHVPGLLLQPLVENAIRHGIAPRNAPGRVVVSARRVTDRLHLTVTDDGLGLPAGWNAARDAGIGLGNTKRRLTALYGDAQTFSLTAVLTGGVRVDIIIPLR